jgi:hypothetical protein
MIKIKIKIYTLKYEKKRKYMQSIRNTAKLPYTLDVLTFNLIHKYRG